MVVSLRSTNSEYKGMPYIKECLRILEGQQKPGPLKDVGRVKRRALLGVLGAEHNARGFPVADLSELSRSLGSEIDGILGVDLLGEIDLGIDYAAGFLEIRSPRKKGAP